MKISICVTIRVKRRIFEFTANIKPKKGNYID